MPTVAETIVTALADLGVKQIWGVVGDALNPVTDAIRREDRLEWIGVRHEEAGAFAASAQAQLTGTLGVCMGTVGPGSLHLLNGLYDAKKSRAPVLAVCGQVPLRRRRLGLLPGGRQRRRVPRCGHLLPHADQSRAAAGPARAGRSERASTPRGRRAHDARRRRRPRFLGRRRPTSSPSAARWSPTARRCAQAAARIDGAGAVTMLVGHGRAPRPRPRSWRWPTACRRRWSSR